MHTSTVTGKGQVTIPRKIRELMKLETGSRLEFIPDGEGGARIVPATLDLADLEGALPKPEKPVSLEAMRKAIERRGE